MADYSASRRVLILLISLSLLIGIFTVCEIWFYRPQGLLDEAAETPVIQQLSGAEQTEAPPEDRESQKRHIRFDQGQLAIYAGPVGGEGQLLRRLELPLGEIPPRWLAQLTNGGVEFADEESLLMALDSLDELLN